MEMEPPHAEQSAMAAASSHQALQPPPQSPPQLPPSAPTFAVAQRHADSPRHTFKFGVKQLSKDYVEVTEEDPGYFFCAIGQKNPSPPLQHYIRWVYSHYEVDADGRSLISPSKLWMYIAEAPPAPHAAARRKPAGELRKVVTDAEVRAILSASVLVQGLERVCAEGNLLHVRLLHYYEDRAVQADA